MAEQPQRASIFATLRTVGVFLWRYGGRYWWQYAIGFLALFATNWAVVRIPTLIGEILNQLEAVGAGPGGDVELMRGAIEPVSDLALELMVWAIALIVVRTVSRVLFFNPGREIQYKLGVDLFAHLLTLQRPFYARRKVGELVSVAANDTQSVRLLVGFAGLQVLNVAVAIPMHLYQMLRTDWILTLWCVTPVVFGGIYMRWTVHRFYALIRASMEKLAALSDRILESFAGVATVRAHVAEQAAVERFERYNREYLDLQLEVASLRAFAMPVLAFTGYIGTGLVLWVGGNQVLRGELAIGSLASFAALLLSLVSVLTSLAWVLTAISRGVVSLDRVQELLDATPDLPPVAKTHEFTAAPKLELRELGFTHPGRDEPALRGIAVTVEPGHTLGIFGRTGSGKTTLIDLLARVHTPPAGTIFVDGLDARTLALGPLRAGMAVVPQSPFLFSTSLRDNIRLRGERDVVIASDDEEVVDAGVLRRRKRAGGSEPEQAVADERLDAVIEATCLAQDIRALPKGLDTVVGERGVMLSGGQRQRTALARALYRGPKLLLLDDVLSAVDQATETKLVTAIRGLSGGPTTVIVSHRTSVLEHADEILVLERGEVVERGTHAQLIAARGPYAAAHEHQRQERAKLESPSDAEVEVEHG